MHSNHSGTNSFRNVTFPFTVTAVVFCICLCAYCVAVNFQQHGYIISTVSVNGSM